MASLDASSLSMQGVLDRLVAVGAVGLPASTLGLLREGWRLGVLPRTEPFGNDVARMLLASDIDRGLRGGLPGSPTALLLAGLRAWPRDAALPAGVDRALHEVLAAHARVLPVASRPRPVASPTRSPKLLAGAALGVVAAVLLTGLGVRGSAFAIASLLVPVLLVALLFRSRRPPRALVPALTGVDRLDFAKACAWSDAVDARLGGGALGRACACLDVTPE